MTTGRIDRATAAFRAGERNLYTDAGQKIYADEEHERRYDALLERFDREKDIAVGEADRAIERAERTLALEHRDLSDSLTTTELERANAKKPYVEDDVRNLPLDDLERRVEAARASGDKPTLFLYARALPRRAQEAYEAGVNPEQGARLERLAKELEGEVRGSEAKRALEKAAKEKRDANSLKIYAQSQRAEVDGTSAGVAQDLRSRISQSL